jgi:type II secretory pathway component PulM
MASVPLRPITAQRWRIADLRRSPVLPAVLAIALLVLAGLALWEMQKGIERMQRERADDARRLALAQQAAAEITRLERAPLPAPVDARTAFDASLAAAGLRAAVTQVEWQQQNRVRVTLANARFPDVIAWLEALQRQSGLRPVEATFSALAEPGAVRVDLILGR